MKLTAHDQRDDAVSHRYSIQDEDGFVWLLFDIPPKSPLNPTDVVRGLDTAPDLLEALRRVDHTLTVHRHLDSDTNLHDFIRDALAKATKEK